MSTSRKPSPTGYALPLWFIRRNVRTAAQLADLGDQIKVCTCENCHAFRADDGNLPDDEAHGKLAMQVNEVDDSPMRDQELSQERHMDEIHYKTFAELRDITCAALVPNEQGTKMTQPERLSVILRIEREGTDSYDHATFAEPAWSSRAVSQLAREIGASLISLDIEDLEDLGCDFYRQIQDVEKLKETESTIKPIEGVEQPSVGNPRANEATAGSQEGQEIGTNDSTVDESWSPDAESFTTFLEHFFAGQTIRKIDSSSYERNRRAVSTVLDAVAVAECSHSTTTEAATSGCPGAMILHIIDCNYLNNAMDWRTKKRLFVRVAEVMKARREEGHAMVMIVSTTDARLEPGSDIYRKLRATHGSIVVAQISKRHELDSRENLRKSTINTWRMRRHLRQHLARFFPAELIEVSADWERAERGLALDLLGKELWSQSEIFKIKIQLTGRAWKRPRLGLDDIRAILRRMGMYLPEQAVVSEGVSENKEFTGGQRNDSSVDLLNLDEYEEKLRQCIINRDNLKTEWDDVVVDTDTKELLQLLVSSKGLEIDSGSELLLRELSIGGILLYGPPGTGKTHVSRAIAKASGSRMLAVDAAALQSRWTGEAEKHIRAAFTLAAKLHPCVLFLDEVDALFFRRSSDDESWQRSFITQFLECMDGVSNVDKAPLVIAATNRPWDIDGAFLRRLPTKIYIGLPKTEQRARILRVLLKDDDLDPAVNIDGLAQVTEKYSGSDLKSLCAHAAIIWRGQETQLDILYNSLSPKFSQVQQGPKKVLLGVDHFVEALCKIQPNETEDILFKLEEFSKKYQPTAVGRNPGTRFIYNDLTKRHEMFHVRDLICHSPEPKDITPAYDELENDELENELQVQSWCQLCLREHFMHRIHLVFVFLRGAAEAITQGVLQFPSAATEPGPIQEVSEARSLPSPLATTDPIIDSSGSKAPLGSPKTPVLGGHESLKNSIFILQGQTSVKTVAAIEISPQMRFRLLSEDRIRNLWRLMVQQVDRYHFEQRLNRHPYSGGRRRGIFLLPPPIGSESMSASDEHVLRYHPLPNTTSIRLLKFEPARELSFMSGEQFSEDLNLVLDPIRCSLALQDLTENPIYDALSYTWGDPGTLYFDQDWNSSQDQEASQKAWHAKAVDIFIDDRPVSVGTNLYTALQAARGIWMRQLRSGPDAGLGRYSGTVWVDAICINQQDSAEKTEQVKMMSRIYQQAQNVLAWLGGEDSLSRQAILDLRNISAAIYGNAGNYDESHSAKWAGRDLNSEHVYEDLGIPAMSAQRWAGIFAFLNRAWFKRAWVLQEISFAKNPVLLCGLLQFSLPPILKACMFLQWSRWFQQITRFVSCEAEETDAGLDSKSPSTTVQLHPSRKSNSFNPNWGFSMFRNRIALGTETQMRLLDRNKGNAVNFKLDLQTLLLHHRSTEAGDPRDKIYAFLGMAQDNHGPEKLIPDYSLPVSDVYTRAMKFLIASSGTLGPLCLRETVREPLYETTVDGSKKPVHLATWVPNFNVELIPGPMDRHDWTASKGLRPSRYTVSGYRIDVSGIRLGSIVDEVEYDELKLLELANFLERFVSRSPAHGLEGLLTRGPRKATCQVQDTVSAHVKQQRPFEILWRTLCCDTYGSVIPAPSTCGQAFKDLLRYQFMLHEGIAIGGACGWLNDGTLPKNPVKLAMTKDPVKARIQAGKSYTGFLKLMGLLNTESEDEIVYSSEFLDLEATLDLEDGKNYNRINAFLDRALPFMDSGECLAFSEEIRISVSKQRLLFATDDGRLGLGPSSLRATDQIWILAGGDTPFILRPQAAEGEYEMVGLAYVHGIMYGEAVQADSQRLCQSLTLI